MMWFKKKHEGNQINVVEEHYVPAFLPTYGMALETFVTSDYPMERPEAMESAYKEAEEHLTGIVTNTDHHSAGVEGDHYIDNQIEHVYAVHEAAIAEREKQVVRIRNAIAMRINELDEKISAGMVRRETLKAEIEPLEGLRSPFQIRLGSKSVSIGVIVTVIAMVMDAAVNYSFLQTVLLSNALLLLITVACMSLMSDGSMCALGLLLSLRKEKITAKPLFWSVCIALFCMFIISVVASVMLRVGSMDSTYGTINAAGEFIGKQAFSLAEYGVTLITSFVTTATGILSFAFSLDDNAYLISVREEKKNELKRCEAELAAWINEKALLENAPDIAERNSLKRAAAEHNIDALRKGLKLLLRKLMTERIADATFTEKMAASGREVVESESVDHLGKGKPMTVSTNVSLSKAS